MEALFTKKLSSSRPSYRQRQRGRPFAGFLLSARRTQRSNKMCLTLEVGIVTFICENVFSDQLAPGYTKQAIRHKHVSETVPRFPISNAPTPFNQSCRPQDSLLLQHLGDLAAVRKLDSFLSASAPFYAKKSRTCQWECPDFPPNVVL